MTRCRGTFSIRFARRNGTVLEPAVGPALSEKIPWPEQKGVPLTSLQKPPIEHFYCIQFQASARKALDGLPRRIQIRIGQALNALAKEPHLPAVKKLSDKHDIWRLRVGDYRVLYTIERGRLVILVVKIGHRREVYR